MRPIAHVLTYGAAMAILACGTLTTDSSTVDAGGPEAGSDTPASTDGDADGSSVPDGGFAIDLLPPRITADPGETIHVAIHLLRSASFKETVDLTLPGTLPAGLSLTSAPAPSADGDADSTFDLAVSAVPDPIDVSLTVKGTGRLTMSATRTFDVRIGSILVPDVTNKIVIPSYANVVTVKAWGGGGGGDLSSFGSGGPGGFASAKFAVTPGGVYFAITGKRGVPGATLPEGASGGGYSGFKSDDGTWLLIAGGGGGGGDGTPGGHGGGVTGQPGSGTCSGGGGTQSTGGPFDATCGAPGSPGSALQGGAGTPAASPIAGGAPGGGTGGDHAGGGGGGWFGGGGGGFGGAGGGGSGYLAPAAIGGALETGVGNYPGGRTDPDYVTGVAAENADGLVIVRLPKP